MVNYRRDYSQGAIYFFTLTLKNRKSTYLTTHIDLLGQSFRDVRSKFNFMTHAIIVLPDHLHVVWELPKDECNYSQCWRLIKTRFTQGLIKKGVAVNKNNRGEGSIWQNRFWEHRIRNDLDLERHIDYIHYNSVKRGYTSTPESWPYSSIHRYIQQGIIIKNWKSGERWGFGEC